METWNETVEVNATLIKYDGEWRDKENDYSFPLHVEAELDAIFPDAEDETEVGMTMGVNVTGYYIAATMYGNNGDPGEPAEGEETKELDYVELDTGTLSKKAQKAIFDVYEDSIESTR